MAHFAQVDENNIVIQVLVTDDNDPNGDEGYQWLVDNFGGSWIKTSYNTRANQHTKGKEPVRGNYANIGMTYDQERDVFLHPKPFPSWVIDEDTFLWRPPIDAPDPFGSYTWDEASLSWFVIPE
jgi:hypothetical protein